MLKNITLGQYYPGNTTIHKMDPRIKIIIALLMLIAVFLINTFWGFIGFGVFVFCIIGIAKVGVKNVLRGIKPLLFIIIFTFVLNIFFYKSEMTLKTWDIIQLPSEAVITTGTTVTIPADLMLVQWGVVSISVGGVINAIVIALRLVLLIMATSLLTLTTSPMQLTDGIEKLADPLKKIKFPVHEMAMMMSIAMRFIPTLSEETDRIMKAQTARGAEFDSGNIIKRAKNMIPLLVPLFVGAFKRADELALAMEARCYKGGEGRTRLKVLRIKKRDVIALVVGSAVCGVIMVLL